MIMTQLLSQNQLTDMMRRHWSPQSQAFTGGDALCTALADGWTPHWIIFQQGFEFAGGRQVSVYHVLLHRDGVSVHMRIVENPTVARLIQSLGVQVATLQDGEPQPGYLSATLYARFAS
jgi:hypothetical protein